MLNWLKKLSAIYFHRSWKVNTPEQTLNVFKNGVLEIDKGNPLKAVAYFSEAITASPNSAKLHHYRADAYALAGNLELAIIDYDISVRLNPTYPDTYLDRGNANYRLDFLSSALKDFSEAIRLKPNWAKAHANRAVIYAELGDIEKSNLDASQAVEFGVDESQLEEMLETVKTNLPGES